MSALANPTSKKRIHDLLEDLPPESLAVVEGFVRSLREQVMTEDSAEATPFRYPTVSLSLDRLRGLVGMLPPVGGNALAETEALYDVESRD